MSYLDLPFRQGTATIEVYDAADGFRHIHAAIPTGATFCENLELVKLRFVCQFIVNVAPASILQGMFQYAVDEFESEEILRTHKLASPTIVGFVPKFVAK